MKIEPHHHALIASQAPQSSHSDKSAANAFDGLLATPESSPPQSSHSGKSSANAFDGLLTAPGSSPAQSSDWIAAGIVAPQSSFQQRNNVFGFGDLGVFGRYGAQAGQGPQVSGSDGGEALPDDLAEFRQQSALDAVMDCPSAAASGRWRAGDLQISAHSFKAPASSTVLAAAIGAASTQGAPVSPRGDEAFSGDDCAPAADGEPGTMPERGSDISAVYISVSGEDGALTVVARNGNPQDDPLELQRLIEKTAAEFDMQVQEIHLNGSAAQSFKSILGGSNGSRTR